MNRERKMIFVALLTLLISTRSFGYSPIYPTGFGMADFAEFGNGFSWPNVNITVDIDPTFTAAYGVNGEAAFNNALATWDTIFSTHATGASTQAGNSLFDLESIALHELGHGIGLHHPDKADDINRNYLDDPDDPDANPPTTGPATGAEMMNSGISPGEVQRELNDDDFLGFNHLYDFDLRFTDGAAAELGTSLGSDIDIFAFSFSNTSFLQPLAGVALALTDVGIGVENRIIGVDLFFNTDEDISVIPLPGAFWLFGSGMLGLIGVARRKKSA